MCVLFDITYTVLEYAATLQYPKHSSSNGILMQEHAGLLHVDIGLLQIGLVLCLVKNHRLKFAQFMYVKVFGARKVLLSL